MCPVVLRLIKNMYTNQEIQIKWTNLLSTKCEISKRVKLGGCLSPSLFSVYLNNLFTNLKKSNIGCRYGSEYMGVYGYADDLSLLWPSFSGLKEMLNICERYAINKKITFNASKSQLLYFSKKDDPLHIKKPIVRMKHGQIIPYVEKLYTFR